MAGTVRHGNPVTTPAPTAGDHATPRDYVLTRSIPAGGSAGQQLFKQSGTDYDEAWAHVPPIVAGSASSALAPDASVGGNMRDVVVSGSAISVAVPTNGVNRQTLEYAFYASVATTITFNSSIRLSTGISSRAFTVAQGQTLFVALKYSTMNGTGYWTLVAGTVSAT